MIAYLFSCFLFSNCVFGCFGKPNTNTWQGMQLTLDRVHPLFNNIIMINRSKCIHFVKQVKWNYLNMRTHVNLKGHICQIEIREVYQLAGVLRHIEQK